MVGNTLEVLEFSIHAVVEAALERKLDETIVVPVEPPNGALIQSIT